MHINIPQRPMYYNIDGAPITLEEWCEQNNSTARRIGDDIISGLRISTVLLGLDHNNLWFLLQNPYTRPIIFETMVFRPDGEIAKDDEGIFLERYCTKEEALEGHNRVCETVRRGEIK